MNKVTRHDDEILLNARRSNCTNSKDIVTVSPYTKILIQNNNFDDKSTNKLNRLRQSEKKDLIHSR